MIPVSKYVDTKHPNMEGKSDFQVWELLSHDAKMIVVTEYMGDRLDESIQKFGDKILEALTTDPEEAENISGGEDGDAKTDPAL